MFPLVFGITTQLDQKETLIMIVDTPARKRIF